MKTTCYKKYFARLTAAGLLFALFLLSSQALFARDFSSLDSDLQQLENLINDTLVSTEEQQKLLDNLKSSLNASGILIASYENIIKEQENLLQELQTQLSEMSETYKMRSSLSARSAQSSKFWRNFTLIAIPVTAVISGIIGYAVGR